MTAEEQVFADLHMRYAARVTGYARGMVGVDDAEDVAQETWAKVWRALPRKLPELEPDGMGAWLMTIARNAAVDWLRHHKTTCSQSDYLSDEHENIPGPPDRSSDGKLALTLASVRPHERMMLLLVGYGYSYVEIASKCQAAGYPMTAGSIKSCLQRARVTARKALEREEAMV